MVAQGSHSSRGAGAGGPKGEAQGTRGQGAMVVQGPIPACGGDRESREDAQARGGRGSCGPPPPPPPAGSADVTGGGGETKAIRGGHRRIRPRASSKGGWRERAIL